MSAARDGNRRRIAIVGSGVAGLYVAHRLHPHDDIAVFEAGDHVGGHTHTHDIELGGRLHAVDTGFIVFNDWTYPNFLRLLDELGVPAQPSDMSFSMRCERSGLEYNGTSINTLFAQRSNLFRPSFWRMIRDILRFNREAPALLEDGEGEVPLGDYLRAHRYSRQFVDHYLVPMAAAIWSASPDGMLGFPTRYLVRFFANHGMLSVDDRPTWRVVKGGSRSYVAPLTAPFEDRILLHTPVTRVTRHADGVTIEAEGRAPERFDAVVLACHSDQALRMLGDPSDAEREILGAIPYQENETVLHTDARLLPKRKLAWASWNYHIPTEGRPRVAVSYWMNKLQSLDADQQLVVTLNRNEDIDPAKILKTLTYHHPIYTPAGIAAQARHGEISGVRNTYYCGAWWRFGFHEDGVWSGTRVARQLGVEPQPAAVTDVESTRRASTEARAG